MAIAALVIGVLSVVLAVLPISSVTQMVGLLLGAGAAGAGYALRAKLGQRGQPTLSATIALWTGLTALILGGLLFVSCQACSGDGEVDERVDQQFNEQLKEVLEGAGKARGR